MERFVAHFDSRSSGRIEVFQRVDETSNMTAEERLDASTTQPARLEKLKKMELSLRQWEVVKFLVRRLLDCRKAMAESRVH